MTDNLNQELLDMCRFLVKHNPGHKDIDLVKRFIERNDDHDR